MIKLFFFFQKTVFRREQFTRSTRIFPFETAEELSYLTEIGKHVCLSLPVSHDVILYHGCQFSGERGEAAHAHQEKEKKEKNPARASRTGAAAAAAAQCPHHEERERESRAEREATSLPFPSSISTDRPRTRVGATQVHSDCPPVSRVPPLHHLLLKMSVGSDFGNPLRKFKLVFLGEQSGKTCLNSPEKFFFFFFLSSCRVVVVNPLHLLASQQVHPVEETDIQLASLAA